MSSEGERNSGDWTLVGRRKGRRKDRLNVQISNTYRHLNRPGLDVSAGHRGQSRHQWWRGPREPPSSLRGQVLRNVFSLFVDGIARSVSLSELRELFEQEGKVADVYISGKKRSHTRESFGFVRFFKKYEAVKAVQQLDGVCIHGGKLKISMAKYSKGGTPMSKPMKQISNKALIQQPALRDQSRIQQSTLRDHRKYTEVLKERRIVPTSSNSQQKTSVNQVPLKLYENHVIMNRLKHAVVIEDDKLPNGELVTEVIKNSNFHATCLSALSPNKIVLFLENELNVMDALSEESCLRKKFQSVRRWTDDEGSKERLVWLDCHGIHPKCWSFGNFCLIGSKWGKTIRFENVRHEFNSLTSVRILVRTTSHKRIDECVQVQWESGSCEVWVREMVGYDGKMGDNLSFDSPFEDDPNNCDVDHILHNNEEDINVNEIHGDKTDVNGDSTERPSQQHTICALPHAKHIENMGKAVGNLMNIHSEINADGGLEIVELGMVENNGFVVGNTQENLQNGKNGSMAQENSRHANSGMVGTQHTDNAAHQTEAHVVDPFCMYHEDVNDLANVRNDFEGSDWFDPIANLEVNLCNSIPVQRLNEADRYSTDQILIMGETSSKRPRGRPKRAPKTATICPPTSSMDTESQETWHAVKMLGVSSNDDAAALSQIRKSRGILNMEHNLS
ncbi:unnamed protein product [Amaranthus hypochondriacus]